MHREGHALRRVGALRVAMVNVGSIAVLVAGCTDRPRGSAVRAQDAGGAVQPGLTVAAPPAASRTDPAEVEADGRAAPSSTPGESSPSESFEPLDSPTPSNRTPPCRQYYPACGTFSTPGKLADIQCGCTPDETCSRAGATGRCVRRPRWWGPSAF
jgi:hypothetical protein